MIERPLAPKQAADWLETIRAEKEKQLCILIRTAMVSVTQKAVDRNHLEMQLRSIELAQKILKGMP